MDRKWEWFPFLNILFALICELLEMEMENYDVVIVGAGESGIGIEYMLKDIGEESIVIHERDKVGSTFHKWPKEMQLEFPRCLSQSLLSVILQC